MPDSYNNASSSQSHLHAYLLVPEFASKATLIAPDHYNQTDSATRLSMAPTAAEAPAVNLNHYGARYNLFHNGRLIFYCTKIKALNLAINH